MEGEQADMLITDPPYNVPVRSVVGRGRIKHAEFAMASGEMSDVEYRAFLTAGLGAAAKVSRPGSLHYDSKTGGTLRTWSKSAARSIRRWSISRCGRSPVGIFRVGGEPYLNNVELGRYGRSRSNLWSYPGVNTFRKDRMAELKLHPTVKPVNLVVDAIRDCTRRGDRILDVFTGSGTTILAAERIGRRCHALELEPGYVDVAIRRWEAFTVAMPCMPPRVRRLSNWAGVAQRQVLHRKERRRRLDERQKEARPWF